MKYPVAGLLLLGLAACGAESAEPELDTAYCLVRQGANLCKDRQQYLIFRTNGDVEAWNGFQGINRFERFGTLNDEMEIIDSYDEVFGKLKPSSGGFQLLSEANPNNRSSFVLRYDAADATKLNSLFSATAGLEFEDRQPVIDQHQP